MDIVISPEIEAKIGREDHGAVSAKDVRECFENHCGKYCYDNRPEHRDGSGNPSPWFVSETNHNRVLKIMFVLEHGKIYLKSAYPATPKVQDLFRKHAR
jgi:hypothetical protein